MTHTCHIGCPKSHRAPPSQAVMGFTGVDREVAEKARTKRQIAEPATSMSVFMLLPVTWFPKPKIRP